MMHPHVSLKAVLVTGAAVLALWVASFVISYVPLGGAALVVALGIAALKAALVALFFMELVRGSLSVKLTIASAVALTAILIAFMLADIATRDRPVMMPEGARVSAKR
jgi:cytochrome c oxidase subunit 4